MRYIDHIISGDGKRDFNDAPTVLAGTLAAGSSTITFIAE